MFNLLEELFELPWPVVVLVFSVVVGAIFLIWRGYQEDQARKRNT